MPLTVKLKNVRKQVDGVVVAGYDVFDGDLPEKVLKTVSVSGRDESDLVEALKSQLEGLRPVHAERKKLIELGRVVAEKAVG